MTKQASNSAALARQAQMSELKHELSGLIADRHSSHTIEELRQGRGGERLTPDQELIATSLFDPIVLDEFAHNIDSIAPTPGDPAAISRKSDGRTYREDVDRFLHARVDELSGYAPQGVAPDEVVAIEGLKLNVLKQLGGDVPSGMSLDDFESKVGRSRRVALCLQEMINEVDTGFWYHYSKNVVSVERLQEKFLQDPKQFSIDEAPLIDGMRSGLATNEDIVGLLVRHPEMESIEAVEFTGPLDTKGTNAALTEMGRRIRAMEFTGVFDEVTIFDPEEQTVSMKSAPMTMESIDGRDDFGLTLSKTVLAEVTHNGVTVELVLKRRFERMPTSPQIRGVSNNIVVLQNGAKVNLQPIAFSAYWRVQKQEASKIYIPPGGSRVAVQAARSAPASDSGDFSDLIVNIGDRSH